MYGVIRKSFRILCRGPKESCAWPVSINSFEAHSSASFEATFLSPCSDSCTLKSPGTFKPSLWSWGLVSAIQVRNQFAALGDLRVNFHVKCRQKNPRTINLNPTNNSFEVRRTHCRDFSLRM